MRKLATCTILFCLAATAALAADVDQERKPGPTVSEWLKSMQKKIGAIVPRKTLSTSTGVAGVRGAKEEQQARLYWKGKKTEEAVTEEEVREFQEAIDYAEKGDKANAVRELEEFTRQYPDSPLIPDVKKTLEMVKQEPDAAAAPASGSKAGQ